MRRQNFFRMSLLGILVCAAGLFAAAHPVFAHCDTLDGPVIQDARKAIATGDITPVLKWVKADDETTVHAAFRNVLADRTKNREAAEHQFFSTLVKIHRTAEGEPFTGLKPAGAVEPAVAEADKALASGSADALVNLITGDIAAGIRKRYAHAAAAFKHKDESVAQGREFVAAYVAFTHYVEQLHAYTTGKSVHGEQGEHDAHKNAHHPAHP